MSQLPARICEFYVEQGGFQSNGFSSANAVVCIASVIVSIVWAEMALPDAAYSVSQGGTLALWPSIYLSLNPTQ
jgi:hypothetical protein